jgi:GT2 family glycosyltransferase
MCSEARPTDPLTISIIVPVHNAGRTLAACLDSLAALLADTPSHEIIVVDNGSTDDSRDIALRYPCARLVSEPTKGAGFARNAGARHARGDILAFTDADCVVSPDWLVRVPSVLREAQIAAAGGKIKSLPPKNDIQDWIASRKILEQEGALDCLVRPFVQTANAFFRRADFDAIGGFDCSFSYGEDVDLSWRIVDAVGGRLAFIPEALVYHDHRCSVRALLHQVASHHGVFVNLAPKWGPTIPKKSWKTSVWELYDVMVSGLAAGRKIIAGRPRKERLDAQLDFLVRAARKWGIISAAWRTKQLSRW